MVLTFYTSVIKGLKLKVRKIWGLIPTLVEVTGFFGHPILNRVKIGSYNFMIVLFALPQLSQSMYYLKGSTVVEPFRKYILIKFDFFVTDEAQVYALTAFEFMKWRKAVLWFSVVSIVAQLILAIIAIGERISWIAGNRHVFWSVLVCNFRR